MKATRIMFSAVAVALVAVGAVAGPAFAADTAGHDQSAAPFGPDDATLTKLLSLAAIQTPDQIAAIIGSASVTHHVEALYDTAA
jgi:hypothetical protein